MFINVIVQVTHFLNIWTAHVHNSIAEGVIIWGGFQFTGGSEHVDCAGLVTLSFFGLVDADCEPTIELECVYSFINN